MCCGAFGRERSAARAVFDAAAGRLAGYAFVIAIGMGRWSARSPVHSVVDVGRWSLVVGRWALGVGRWALGVRRSAFGVRRSAFGVRRSAFGVRRSAFGVRRSAFGVRRSAFGVRRWSRFTAAARGSRHSSSLSHGAARHPRTASVRRRHRRRAEPRIGSAGRRPHAASPSAERRSADAAAPRRAGNRRTAHTQPTRHRRTPSNRHAADGAQPTLSQRSTMPASSAFAAPS